MLSFDPSFIHAFITVSKFHISYIDKRHLPISKNANDLGCSVGVVPGAGKRDNIGSQGIPSEPSEPGGGIEPVEEVES